MLIRQVTAIERTGSSGIMEDGYCNCHFGHVGIFAVIDGVSGLGGRKNIQRNGLRLTGGQWARKRILDTLTSDMIGMNAMSILRIANSNMQVGYFDLGIVCEYWERPAACICIVSLEADGRFSWASAGDCMCAIELRNGFRMLLTKGPLGVLEKQVFQEMKRLQVSSDDEHIQEMLINLRRKRNREYYTVVDSNLNLDLVQSGVLPSDVCKIALFTDGLSLSDDDQSVVAMDILANGLEQRLQNVCEREQRDPECRNPVRFKPSDDKAGILIEVD